MNERLRMSVEDYLMGARTLANLQEQLMPITWGEVQVSADTRTAAADAELFIAEFTGGHIEEGDLKTALKNIFKFSSLLLSSGDLSSPLVTRSASQSMTQRVAFG